MRTRELIGIIAYAFVAGFVLERLRWLPWLGFVLWPVVLLAPIIYALARYRRPLSQLVAYLSVGLLAALAGSIMADYSLLGNAGLSIGAMNATGEAAYSVPLLAVVVTLLFSSRSDANRVERTFYPAAAWTALVVVFLQVEAFVFGASTKMCGAIGWGLYGVMFSPALLHFTGVRMGTAVGIATALVVGGFLPRVIRMNRRTGVLLFIVTAIVISAVGFAVTPVQATPCEPV